MRFNANRLATLAGISSGETSERRSLNESGNQSRHDEDYGEGVDWYKEDLNEADEAPNPFAEADKDDKEAMDQLDAMEEGEEEKAEGEEEKEEGHRKDHMDEMVEINESMLRQEIARMRQERSQRANKKGRIDEEAQLRQAIRKEIGSLVGEMREDLYTTRNWLYGDNKPRHSKKGYVARGGVSIGFE
jgi:uncharacterized protein with von Willebrand factor type A (vWA) domain